MIRAMYPNLLSRIRTELTAHHTVIVGISGHGGAGKSTLAGRLAADFGPASTHIVPVDGLHAKDYLDKAGIFETHD